MSSSSLSNRESPWAVLMMACLKDVKNHCALMFSREADLVMKHMNEDKCTWSLCDSDATFASSTGVFSNKRAKDLETEGSLAKVNGSSVSESHCLTKYFSNLDTASVRNSFSKFSCSIFCSVSSCKSFLLMKSWNSSALGQSVFSFCECWCMRKVRVLKYRLA